jgi:hypothetical protein
MTRTFTATAVASQIVLLVLAISGTISFLARMFPDKAFAPSRVFSSTSGYFGRGIGGYRNCISLAIGLSGLRLSIFPLFRAFHPPMVIPWQQVAGCTRTRFLGLREGVRLDIVGWPRPVYLYSFLGKYGDACEPFYSTGRQPRRRRNDISAAGAVTALLVFAFVHHRYGLHEPVR